MSAFSGAATLPSAPTSSLPENVAVFIRAVLHQRQTPTLLQTRSEELLADPP